MAKVSTYLNFNRKTEAAFNFYKAVFGNEFSCDGIMRFKDVPPSEEMPPLPPEDMNLVMHVSLPIVGGHELMGSDAPESMGFNVMEGNNVYINLMPDTREETRQLFKALSEGGRVEQELKDMFWGDYYGSCVDKFGIHWMFNCAEKINDAV
jgi:PhnB protein